MKSKVKRLSTLACASFTWLLGVSRKEPISIVRKHATTLIPNRLYYTPDGSLHCKLLHITNAERQTPPPPSHLYGTIHMSSVEPVSHKHVRSVGGRFIRHCRNTK